MELDTGKKGDDTTHEPTRDTQGLEAIPCVYVLTQATPSGNPVDIIAPSTQPTTVTSPPLTL